MMPDTLGDLRELQSFTKARSSLELSCLHDESRMSDDSCLQSKDSLPRSFCPDMNLIPPTPSLLEHPSKEKDQLSNINCALSACKDESTLGLTWPSTSGQAATTESPVATSQASTAGWSPSTRTASPSCSINASPMRRSPTPIKKRKTEVPPGFVKRPLNSFMLYRKDHQHQVPTNNHQSISRIIGDMWRKESAEMKNYYDNLAKEERQRHQLENPGYKFHPKKRKNKDCDLTKANAKDILKGKRITPQLAVEDGATMSHMVQHPALESHQHYPAYCQAQSYPNLQWIPEAYNFQPPEFYARYTSPASNSHVLPPQVSHYQGHITNESINFLPHHNDNNNNNNNNNNNLINGDIRAFRDPQDWHTDTAAAQVAAEAQNILYDSRRDSVLERRTSGVRMERTITQDEQYLLPTQAYQLQPQEQIYAAPYAMVFAGLEYEYPMTTRFAPGSGTWEIDQDG